MGSHLSREMILKLSVSNIQQESYHYWFVVLHPKCQVLWNWELKRTNPSLARGPGGKDNDKILVMPKAATKGSHWLVSGQMPPLWRVRSQGAVWSEARVRRRTGWDEGLWANGTPIYEVVNVKTSQTIQSPFPRLWHSPNEATHAANRFSYWVWGMEGSESWNQPA